MNDIIEALAEKYIETRDESFSWSERKTMSLYQMSEEKDIDSIYSLNGFDVFADTSLIYL